MEGRGAASGCAPITDTTSRLENLDMLMFGTTDDVRIERLSPLLPPAILMEEVPLTLEASKTVVGGRRAAEQILDGQDDRLLVIVGPCSIHDPIAGLEYAQRLRSAAQAMMSDLHIVMRVYFEKPRTTVGWKGLINDPDLNGSFAVNKGLRLARGFLRDVTELGVPAGCEFLDPISPQFIADLVSWAAIGARTTESQVHRELASGLSMPVGFKNGTGGSVQIAVDAVRASAHPHHFLSVTKQGLAAIVKTQGNPYGHIILRGGSDGPNYHPDDIARAIACMQAVGQRPRIMVDCSHANSGKNHTKQPEVARSVCEQLVNGEEAIIGVMLESFLKEGRQNLSGGRAPDYGRSITDACMGWERTEAVLAQLSLAVRRRRARAA